jgi:cystinosin
LIRSSSGSSGSGGGLVGTSDFCQYAVELNDVVFSIHALILTLVTLLQCCVYPRGSQKVHRVVQVVIAAAGGLAAAYAAAIWGHWQLGGWRLGELVAPYMQWVYWLYFLSFIKMGVTLVKYVPQVRGGDSAGGWIMGGCSLDGFSWS